MAPQEQSPATQAPPPRSSAAQALGVLAAVSVAGLLISRGKPGPLFFAAGAAAASWLARRRVMREQRPLELQPQRAPEEGLAVTTPAVPNPELPVDAWLARQIAREKEVPVITLDLLDPAPTEPSPPAPLPQIDTEPSPPALQTEARLEPNVSEPLLPAAPPLHGLIDLAKAVDSSQQPPPENVPVYGVREEKPDPAVSVPVINPFLGPDFFVPQDRFASSQPKPSLSVLQALESTESAVHGDSSWMLGIEPLPSWEEEGPGTTAVDDVSRAATDFMQVAPSPSQEVSVDASAGVAHPQQPAFIPPLFQGAALPDEIWVPSPAYAPPVAEAVAVSEKSSPEVHLVVTSLLDAEFLPPAPFDSAAPEVQAVERPVFVAQRPSDEPAVVAPAPLNEPEPAVTPAAEPEAPYPESRERAPEVPVTLAEFGEASFDDPLAAIAIHGTPAANAVPPPPLRPRAPVVDAEIVVRPRTLTQASVVARPPAIPSESGSAAEAALPQADPVPPLSSALPPAPLVVPREQRARKTWRSWWRGE